MVIKFNILITFYISNLINDTVLCFSNIILIEKVISLSENSFIFFTTVKMLLMSFMPQILLFLNSISIFVQFLAVNTTISTQILFKPCSDLVNTKILTRFLWNLNKVSVALMRNCLNKILFRLILFPFSFALFNLASSSPTLFNHLFNSQILNHVSLY